MGIVNTIRNMLDYEDWKPPEKAKEEWMKIQQYRDKIEGVEWMKRRSNQHMRNADNIAGMAASNGR
jgi:hypothetical protein